MRLAGGGVGAAVGRLSAGGDDDDTVLIPSRRGGVPDRIARRVLCVKREGEVDRDHRDAPPTSCEQRTRMNQMP